MSLANFLLLALTASAIVVSSKTEARPHFKSTTVASVLASGKRSDATPVELHGRITAGPETSIFTDSSTCKDPYHSRCVIWVEFDHCTVPRDESPARSCEQLIKERSQPLRNGGTLSILENVTIRGIILTVRKDIIYDRSVPKGSVGFGHLSAYPAQINVAELELKKGG